MKKRILSTLLALVMALSLLPGTAFAAQTGKCGDNVTWILDGGTLTLSGTGETFNYWSFNDLPWHNRNVEIKNIVVRGGITKLNRGIFYGSGNATSVTIPASVVYIGPNAFRDCGKILNINYEGSVSEWNEISIDSSNLGWLFSKISEINYGGSPAASTSISGQCGDYVRWALDSAGTLTLSGKGDTWNYWSFNDLPWHNRNVEIKRIVVKDGITSINRGLFYGSGNAASVSIPDSVTYIGPNAFRDCGSFRTINYGGSVEEWNEINIDSSNLGWLFTLVSTINYAGSPSSDVSISGKCGDYVRWTLDSTGTLTISGKGETWNYWSFNDLPWHNRNTEIKNIVVKEGITKINRGLFYGSGNATSLTIPASVVYIGPNAFRDCGKLEKIYYAGTLTKWTEINIDSSNNNYLNGANTDLIPNSSAPLAKYTVTLRSNGGTVSKNSITVTENGKYTGLPTPTRSGYTFNGWYTASSGGTRVTASSTILTNSDHILYAHWTKNAAEKVTITLNANGGTVSKTSLSVNKNAAYYSQLPTPTRSGYTFKGWYTARTGGTKITSTTKATANRTIYAQWTQNTTAKVTIKLDANGGTVSKTSVSVTKNAPYLSLLPTPTRTGYKFDGWYTAKAGGTKITSTTKATAGRTVYAHWTKQASTTPKMYLITFNANGGSVFQSYAAVVGGSTYRSLPTPTYPGRHFDGWYTSQTGGSKVTAQSKVNLTGNRTLYAHWSTKAASVRSLQTGNWHVTIPAECKVVLYASETSPAQSSVLAASTRDNTLTCTRMAVLSNGTTRYCTRIKNTDYWFTYSHEMTVD